MSHEKGKKTLFGLGLAATGLTAMVVSPVAGSALGLSQAANLGSYYLVYLVGFISLLFGVGYVLIANNLWGELRR